MLSSWIDSNRVEHSRWQGSKFEGFWGKKEGTEKFHSLIDNRFSWPICVSLSWIPQKSSWKRRSAPLFSILHGINYFKSISIPLFHCNWAFRPVNNSIFTRLTTSNDFKLHFETFCSENFSKLNSNRFYWLNNFPLSMTLSVSFLPDMK